ncbi:hypothetical protein [Prochlorococcus sp. MIT 1307]|uniref:hypothetical protein n=1 Tax=Prochlorococcus sp. MIT 1307 TaxID=3096219 RepID=UPI002A7504AE|nr:hypothetical protein [Prochlorococcus sp. MIT 1307]
MRDHPISSVTEPLQYRAIGIVRAKYRPNDPDQITRGHLVDANGLELEAVVLGRVLTLMRRHIDLDKPHLWVVYPRCREADHLHLQIAGIWEPSTLCEANLQKDDSISLEKSSKIICDELPEGDDYFSIRGELIYTKPESGDLVIKVRQRSRPNGSRPLPFKLNLKGSIPLNCLRNFVNLDVRRHGSQLCLEDHKIIAPMPTRGGKKRGEKKAIVRKGPRKPIQ